ncbi:PadR family transcriptional regulator [Haematomicrobium sanguinis]|uniref:PadR family transcriptional regulator n=1 Tax=Haematomicrobium sanguinis TaxID=479106 RepID=UPI00047D7E37|nr:PadR family transcriptional regulator [Haematomicrobium sanguinis]
MPPVFAHGAMRLYLLDILADGNERHGYEIIKALSDRFGGTYSPSAGSIYPRLSKLVEEGLLSSRPDGRRTVYRIAEAGLAELDARRSEVEDIREDVADSIKRLAEDIRGDIRDQMRSLKADMAASAAQVRRDSRSGSRGSRTSGIAGSDTRNGGTRIEAARLKALELELQRFRDDVRLQLRLSAARGGITAATEPTIRVLLEQAKANILDTLQPGADPE